MSGQAHEHVTVTATLLRLLARAGWVEDSTRDPYAAAAGQLRLTPARAKRARGHAPAQLVTTGELIGLTTYDRDGAEFESVTWSWVDPANLQRVHDYVTQALADAVEMRGGL